MKLSSSSSSSSSNKPISSPSRVEKFPPPLMRFLRSNGGSRSRSRSRSGRRSSRLSSKSSPMFVITKKNASSSTGIETTQTTHEPSSPKVSCMGQVHVHHQRSSKFKSKSKSKPKQNPSIKIPKCSSCSCSWIHEALFCKCLKSKFPGWRRKCCLFSQFGYGRKDENIEESVKTESRRQFTVSYEENPREEDEEKEEEEKEERVFTSSSSSTTPPSSTIPPKNALLLMRCRSDPCRNRFSGGFSSVIEEKPELSNKIEEDEEIPTSEKEPIFIDSASESRIDLEEKMGSCEDFENLSNGKKRGNIRNGALMKVNGGFSSSSSTRSLPLTLARCKSESETGYWNKRKNSGFDEKCPPLLL